MHVMFERIKNNFVLMRHRMRKMSVDVLLGILFALFGGLINFTDSLRNLSITTALIYALCFIFLIALIYVVRLRYEEKKPVCIMLLHSVSNKNQFFRQLVLSLFQEAQKKNFELVWMGDDSNSGSVYDIEQRLKDKSREIKGCIFVPASFDDKYGKELAEILHRSYRDIVVILDERESFEWLSVLRGLNNVKFVANFNKAVADCVGNHVQSKCGDSIENMAFCYVSHGQATSNKVEKTRGDILSFAQSCKIIDCNPSQSRRDAFEQVFEWWMDVLLSKELGDVSHVVTVCANDDLALGCHDAFWAAKKVAQTINPKQKQITPVVCTFDNTQEVLELIKEGTKYLEVSANQSTNDLASRAVKCLSTAVKEGVAACQDDISPVQPHLRARSLLPTAGQGASRKPVLS